MFAKLKKLLSECHLNSNEFTDKLISTSSADYCYDRALESITLAKNGIDVDRNLVLAIKLCNVARLKNRG